MNGEQISDFPSVGPDFEARRTKERRAALATEAWLFTAGVEVDSVVDMGLMTEIDGDSVPLFPQ